MKKLGLVGGMGPESTISYYHGIVYGVQRRMGRPIFPALTIESVDVFRVLELCGQNAYTELTDYLLAAIGRLAAAGAEVAALCANTPHIVFDALQKRSPIPLVSVIDATCEETLRCGYDRVGLLGTTFTMNGDFFKKPFEEKAIAIVAPALREQAYISRKIAGELELGVVKDETRRAFFKIVRRMRDEEHIQAVILGCTELPLLFSGMDAAVPVLDTLQIHLAKLIDGIV